MSLPLVADRLCTGSWLAADYEPTGPNRGQPIRQKIKAECIRCGKHLTTLADGRFPGHLTPKRRS